MQTIFTDGATIGPNGKFGSVSKVGLGVHIPGIKNYSQITEGKSNNEAEFMALIWGVKLAINLGLRKVKFLLDSKIVYKRANGNRPWGKWENPRMNAFQDELNELIKGNFDHIEFKWIPREKNYVADDLSKGRGI